MSCDILSDIRILSCLLNRTCMQLALFIQASTSWLQLSVEIADGYW